MSCEKIFHPEDPSLAAIDSYEELSEATEGVYGRLLDVVDPEADYGMGRLYLPNYKGDDITRVSGGYGSYYQESTCTLEDNMMDPFENDYLLRTPYLWDNLYLVLISANNILTQFPKPNAEPEDYRYLLGEIYLIRAYTHFRLTRTFGRIPLIVDTEVKYNTPLYTYDEIYTQIMEDLEQAAELLPPRASESRIPYVTPHRGSARAIMAEVCMAWAGYPALKNEKYEEAARIAGNLIDSAGYYDIGLLPDFKHVWNRDPIGNTEVLFSLSFTEPGFLLESEKLNPYGTGYLENRWNTYYIQPDSLGPVTDFFSCEINFFNNFPNSYRKDLTFVTRIYVPDSFYTGSIDTGYIQIDHWNSCGRPYYRKFIQDPIVVSAEELDRWWLDDIKIIFGTPRIYLFRYAHTLLTFAEAKARMGEPDALAYEAVNRIRRRANKADPNTPSSYDLATGLSPEAFADSVVWERAWELAGEPEGRWFDLLRLDQVRNLPGLRHEYEGDLPKYPVTEEDYFFAIPEYEQILNPNLAQ